MVKLDLISIESLVLAFSIILEDGLLEFMANMSGALKNTIGFPSDGISNTLSCGIVLLPVRRTVDGASILPFPFTILAVLSPFPGVRPLPSPIGLAVIGSAVFVGSTTKPSCIVQLLAASLLNISYLS